MNAEDLKTEDDAFPDMAYTDDLMIEEPVKDEYAIVYDNDGPLLWYYGCGSHKIGMAPRLARALGLLE